MNNINSKTQLFGLIGYPITHSFSPYIHNYIFDKYGINAIYMCLPVEAKGLKAAIIGAKNLGYQGLNITIPYKEKVIPLLDKLDKEAAIIGAVNTIKIEGEKLLGFNTDGKGFISSLRRINFPIKNSKVILLGAGGAAKACSVCLAKEGVKEIHIYDIFYDKALGLGRKIKKNFSKLSKLAVYKDKNKLPLKEANLIINATGVGLKSKDQAIIELDHCFAKPLVYDLIYNPERPVLLQQAQARGLAIINGLWMLIDQALEADYLWLNKDVKGEAKFIHNYINQQIKS